METLITKKNLLAKIINLQPVTDYVAEYTKLCVNQKYHINLYSVIFEEKRKIFRYGILKEFDDPELTLLNAKKFQYLEF